MRTRDRGVPIEPHVAALGTADRELRRLVREREDALLAGGIAKQQVWVACAIGPDPLLQLGRSHALRIDRRRGHDQPWLGPGAGCVFIPLEPRMGSQQSLRPGC